jgi:sialate O-acetylesterase
MKTPASLGLLLMLLLAMTSYLNATVVPNPLFSDNAVLQQGMPIPVWGTANDAEEVSVRFDGNTFSTIAKDGKWMVMLPPHSAGGPYEMVFYGQNTNTVTNVLVGEVWLCSGQSNMERHLGLQMGQKPIVNWEAEAASANYPQLRQFSVSHAISTNPVETLCGSWQVCSPSTVTNFTAVGYYFGRDLQKKLKVPVGLIHSSWGGTPAEAWTRKEAMATNPALLSLLTSFTTNVANFPEKLAKYQSDEPKLKADYTNALAKAIAEAKPTPRPPAPPVDPLKDSHSPCCLFNAMIHPLIPYAIRGVIWYQGESNAERGKEYRTLFPAMIADWRSLWGIGNFPFLYVQIAPHEKMTPEIREAQFLTLAKSPNTAMAVIIDHGDAKDIHPAEKEPVGQRLALAARALAYGEKIEYSGPLYKSMKIDGNKVTLSFSHTGGGLMAKDGDLKGFTLVAKDGQQVPAKAVISGNTVVISSKTALDPVAVRYGWTNVPEGNLFNTEGLPASPFRTDIQ